MFVCNGNINQVIKERVQEKRAARLRQTLSKLTIYTTNREVTLNDHKIINTFKSWKQIPIDFNMIGPQTDTFKKLLNTFNINLLPEPPLHGPNNLPNLDGLINIIKQHCKTEYLCYINSDIILFPDFLRTFDYLSNIQSNFFMVGQRRDLPSKYLDIQMDIFDQNYKDYLITESSLHAKCGVDYFLMRTDLIKDVEVPPFVVPRGYWDHWLCGLGRRSDLLIDVTETVTAFQTEPASRGVPAEWRTDMSTNRQLYSKYKGCDIASCSHQTKYTNDGAIYICKR